MSKSAWIIGIIVILILIIGGMFMFGSKEDNSLSTDDKIPDSSGVDISDIESQSSDELIDNSIIEDGDDVEDLGDLF